MENSYFKYDVVVEFGCFKVPRLKTELFTLGLSRDATVMSNLDLFNIFIMRFHHCLVRALEVSLTLRYVNCIRYYYCYNYDYCPERNGMNNRLQSNLECSVE